MWIDGTLLAVLTTVPVLVIVISLCLIKRSIKSKVPVQGMTSVTYDYAYAETGGVGRQNIRPVRNGPVNTNTEQQNIRRLHPQYADIVNRTDIEISREFQNIQKKSEKQHQPLSVGRSLSNSSRNLCKDILPYDGNRVKLKTFTDEEGDYINASFITGLSGRREYIATQTPTPATQLHFWTMVLEQGVKVIVDIHLDEDNTYLPCGSEQKVVGSIDICSKGKQDRQYFTKKSIEITHKNKSTNVYAIQINSSLRLEHTQALAECIQSIRNEIRKIPQLNLIAVHCRDGSHNTGLFIALDHYFRIFESGGRVLDPNTLVTKLREERLGMVGDESLYKSLYSVLKLKLEYENDAVEEVDEYSYANNDIIPRYTPDPTASHNRIEI